jgi:hypothetical protein
MPDPTYGLSAYTFKPQPIQASDVVGLTNPAPSASYVIQQIGSTYSGIAAPNSGLTSINGQVDYGVLVNLCGQNLAGTGGVIFTMPGTYNYATPISYLNPNTLILRGSGRYSTILNWTGGNAVAKTLLNFNSGARIQGQEIVLEDFQVFAPTVTNLTALDLTNVDKATAHRIYLNGKNAGAGSYGFYTRNQGNNSLILDDCRADLFTTGFLINADHVHLRRCQSAYTYVGFAFLTEGEEILAESLHAYQQQTGGLGFEVSQNSGGSITLIEPYSENPGAGYAQYDYYFNTVQTGNTSLVVVNPGAANSPPLYSINGPVNLITGAQSIPTNPSGGQTAITNITWDPVTQQVVYAHL